MSEKSCCIPIERLTLARERFSSRRCSAGLPIVAAIALALALTPALACEFRLPRSGQTLDGANGTTDVYVVDPDGSLIDAPAPMSLPPCATKRPSAELLVQ